MLLEKHTKDLFKPTNALSTNINNEMSLQLEEILPIRSVALPLYLD